MLVRDCFEAPSQIVEEGSDKGRRRVGEKTVKTKVKQDRGSEQAGKRQLKDLPVQGMCKGSKDTHSAPKRLQPESRLSKKAKA